MERCKVYNA